MENYVKYPTESYFPEEDFEARKAIFGRGSTIYIGEKKINGGIVVYLNYLSEGNEGVFTKKNRIERKCESNITICGYRNTSFLFGKRVRLIPKQEQRKVKSKLLRLLPKKINSVDFWQNNKYRHLR